MQSTHRHIGWAPELRRLSGSSQDLVDTRGTLAKFGVRAGLLFLLLWRPAVLRA